MGLAGSGRGKGRDGVGRNEEGKGGIRRRVGEGWRRERMEERKGGRGKRWGGKRDGRVEEGRWGGIVHSKNFFKKPWS